MAKTLKVKLVRSLIGRLPKQKKTIEALGLKKIGQVIEIQDNPQSRGMIEVVKHMIEVSEM
ncbi:50S ribosomal protein L30 [Alkaliphilus peptidifermentans]|uniref:Large ribosomal subunit protein uL30 n=1 Tax=Alkaliphilus peptidifermentans DSM 18978 TaxID=1120976 RepID=A0A1G5L7Q5_9FIRM|nr:50S ribosomal protein L30 [Alkaliphilus peptidifermentans]SCZ08915.1 LSU ribosomal protein L30P [Alkaliphilus peptidifermentans DSM 18978]